MRTAYTRLQLDPNDRPRGSRPLAAATEALDRLAAAEGAQGRLGDVRFAGYAPGRVAVYEADYDLRNGPTTLHNIA